MASHPGSQEDYANVFARLHPEFCPTQALSVSYTHLTLPTILLV